MNIGILIIAIVGGLVGVASTLYCVLSLPAVIVWKFYRKIANGISLFN